MTRKVLHTILFLVIWASSNAQYNYPKTKTVDSSDTYFGVTYKDPYRWLENLKDSTVFNWFKEQKEFADKEMDQLAGVDSFLSQISHFEDAETWERVPCFKTTSGYLYMISKPGQLSQKLYYKSTNDTTEHLIFDTWNIHSGMRYQLLDYPIGISPDEKYLFAAFDKNGEEYPFIKVYDFENKKWLNDSIPNCTDGSINWASNSKGFIYKYNIGDRNATNATETEVVKCHALFTSNNADKLIMNDSIRNTIEKKISNAYHALVYTNNSLKRVYTIPNNGFGLDKNAYYISNTELLNPIKHWKLLYSKTDSVYDFKETNDGYYFISAKGNGFKSLRYTSYNNPDFANAKILFPEDSIWQLEYLDETKSYILVFFSKYGFLNKTVFIDKKTGKEINVSAINSFDRFSIYTMGTNTDECVLYNEPVNKPKSGLLLNIANNKLSNDGFWATQGQTFVAGSDDIVSELIEVPSYDGTLVPMSIMRNKNTKLDGNNVCILWGYGAYGTIVRENYFNKFNISNNLLVQHGVVLVHAYVRGGGEKGEAWHRAGMKETKPNSWKDYIACAEYLIKNKYTQSSKLSCFGGSAGGTLIGRAITERPDLFAAATIQSGTVNLIRSKAWPNLISNYPEFGNPEIESEMKGIIEMDAVIHVLPNTKYPAVYFQAGMNDPRVPIWMSGKMAATLQANNSSGKLVLLDTNFEGGHNGNANAATSIDKWRSALKMLFFLLWQSGHKDFQPK
ncbi:MAG TPA: prolyl oligopeptidase family serine peptidase [Bacteroidia bacterium]|nr:prolyl oligopeptidase family serine peptidase [Bacteroidia bacterium]